MVVQGEQKTGLDYIMTNKAATIYKKLYGISNPWFGKIKETTPARPYQHYETLYQPQPAFFAQNYVCDSNFWARNVGYRFGDLAIKSIKSSEGVWYSVDRNGNVRMHLWATAGFGRS